MVEKRQVKGFGASIIKPPKNVKLSNEPGVYRRDLLDNWIRSTQTKEVKELIELENLFKLLKGTTDRIMYEKKVLGNEEFNKTDLAYFKLLKETLVDLNRLKYGDKKVNVNVGYDDIREMMFGPQEEDVSPPSK
ncbi:MAG TPA: hypothetical protein ENI23_09550 [bacterium]|nr:hypothetical protein [bacterium]